MIAKVKENVHIPVCGNGDIFSAELALLRQKQSGTDSVMIGRGAMGNPWIFRAVKELQAGRQPDNITCRMKQQMVIRHYHMMLDDRPEWIAVREMRKHIGWYIRGLKGAAQFRDEINRCSDAVSAIRMIKAFFEQNALQEESE